MVIDNFRGEYRFLSNFWNVSVTYEGKEYLNSEAAYQAAKALDETVKKEFQTLNPYQAKKLGSKITLRPDWEEVKYRIMYEIVYNKFSTNPDVKTLLLETGDEELIEGNDWRDTYWGICKGEGQNNLGKILMKVREELKENEGK